MARAIRAKGSSRDRLAGAVLWSGIAVGISNAAGLAVGVALARMLGREGYGEVGVIVASCTLFTQLGGLGLGLTATKYTAQMRSRRSRKRRPVPRRHSAARRLCRPWSSRSSSRLYAPELALVLNRPGLVTPLRLAGIVLFLQGIDSVQMSILAGYEAFAALARVMLLRILVNVPATIDWRVRVQSRWRRRRDDPLDPVYGRAPPRRAEAVFSRAGVSIRYAVDLAMLRPLWEFSLPAFLTTVVTLASMWGVNALLVNQPDGYLQMGLFNAANQWRALGTFIPSVFNPATFSIQSNLFATNRGVVPPLGYRQPGRPGHGRGGCGDRSEPLLAVSDADVRTTVSKRGRRCSCCWRLGWFLVAPTGAFWSAAVSRDQAWTNFLFIAIGAGCQFAWPGPWSRAARAESPSPSCTPG